MADHAYPAVAVAGSLRPEADRSWREVRPCRDRILRRAEVARMVAVRRGCSLQEDRSELHHTAEEVGRGCHMHCYEDLRSRRRRSLRVRAGNGSQGSRLSACMRIRCLLRSTPDDQASASISWTWSCSTHHHHRTLPWRRKQDPQQAALSPGHRSAYTLSPGLPGAAPGLTTGSSRERSVDDSVPSCGLCAPRRSRVSGTRRS